MIYYETAFGCNRTLLRRCANASFADIGRAEFAIVRPARYWFNDYIVDFEWTWRAWCGQTTTEITINRYIAVSSLYFAALFAAANRPDQCMEWIQIEIWSIRRQSQKWWHRTVNISNNFGQLSSSTWWHQITTHWNSSDWNFAATVCIADNLICYDCQWFLQGILRNETPSNDQNQVLKRLDQSWS